MPGKKTGRILSVLVVARLPSSVRRKEDPAGVTSAQLMRYWWVDQNRTYRQEVGGNYLWSPKLNANGARHPF
jgi:hypothetical protein